MNLYGFAGGDPVNFTDPFGLKVVVRDERALALIQNMIRGSATFASMWKAMVLAPGDQATFAIDLDDEKGVLSFSGGTNGTGHTICGFHKCQSKINSNRLSADVLVDEAEVIKKRFHGLAGYAVDEVHVDFRKANRIRVLDHSPVQIRLL